MAKGFPDFSFTTHIRTLEADNIIIDALKVGAYTERRSTLANDNEVTTPTAPPSSDAGIVRRGKFFPRGCRGFLDAIGVYCYRTGTGTITMAVSPQPGIGEIYTVTLTPGTSWDWIWGSVRKFWNYDSMFIWVKAVDADVYYGFESVPPYDYLEDTNVDDVWIPYDWRMFFRADMVEQTVGDIPVSGTVNTIEVPSQSVSGVGDGVIVPTETLTTILSLRGVGKMTRLTIHVTHSSMAIYITADGVNVHRWCFIPRAELTADNLNTYAYSTATPGIQLLSYTLNGECRFTVSIHMPFMRSLEVKAYHVTGSNQAASIAALTEKLAG